MAWTSWLGLVMTLWLGTVSKPKAKRKTVKQKRTRKTRARASAMRRTTRSKRTARRETASARTRATSVSLSVSPQSQPSAAVPLVPASPPRGRALLVSPGNEQVVDSLHPTFRWLSIGGATHYEVVWGEDSTLSMPYTLQSVATEATVPRETPLQPGRTYYWRVRGGNAHGWSAWSETHWFRVPEEIT